MFRLALVFFGDDALIKRWRFFVVLGLLAGGFGLALLYDLHDGVADIAAKVLAAVLLLQGIFELIAGTAHTHLRRRLQMLRGLALVVVACLVLDFPWNNSITSGALFASAFIFNGLLRLGSSWLIRYPSWRQSALLGAGYLVMAVLLLTNWPLPDELNVSLCFGLALLATGWVLIRGALRLRRLPTGSALASIELFHNQRYTHPAIAPFEAGQAATQGAPLVVHIWTAVASTQDRIKLPIIERYIVALSRKGNASSGHAALECGPGVYISHHPLERLQINAQNVVQQAKATEINNRPGRWGSSYAEEEAATQPSTIKIRFRVYSPLNLQAFWDGYQQDATYNFTHRNCSSVVVQAVDAALEGVFAEKPFWRTMLRLVFHPDMWLAGSVRVRAESLAWSPGLALDYIGAVRRITDPRYDLRQHLLRRWRTGRRRRQLTYR
jgi:uncharacterized membrane protein HdeD (DUF308 family)